MITADQIIAHCVGDYILQSDWMANEKTRKSVAALAHALIYTLCFIPFVIDMTTEDIAIVLGVIGGSHFIIDRWRLARFVVWMKNFLSPRQSINLAEKEKIGVHYTPSRWWYPWSECAGTGYHSSRPVWLAMWLTIIADNIMHIIINGAVLHWISQ